MEQLTLWNILAFLLGILVNLLSYLKKLKKENKQLRIDAISALTALTGLIGGFIGLVFAKEVFESGGATVSPNGWIFIGHAFVCGFMPQVIIDKLMNIAQKRAKDS